MFRYLFSIISLLFVTISPCIGDVVTKAYVDAVRGNVQTAIDNKAANSNYTQNMVLQTDGSGNVVATTVGTDLLADGAIETMHLTDGAVTNADLAGMIDIKKLNLGTLPTSGKHMMIWNATTNEYVFEKYVTSILPADYTELEYIESTGTQYIDTGVDTAAVVDVDFAYTDINYFDGGWAYVYGREASPDPYHQCLIRITPTGNISSSYTDSSVKDMQRHHSVMWDFTDYRKWNFDGHVLYEGVSPDGPASYPIILFAGSLDGSVFRHSKSRIYDLKIYSDKDMNNLVRNFIPAKRNSDGVIGMYDTVTETFFTNKGTGSFIAGPATNEYVTSTLLADCTQLKYIESTGTQYIDTGVDTAAVVDVDFAYTDINYSEDGFAYVYGREISREPWYHFGIRSDGGYFTSPYALNEDSGTEGLVSNLDTQRHHSVMWDFIDYRRWDFDNQNIYTNTTTANTANYTIVLFAENVAGNIGRRSKSRIYDLKIYSDKDMNNLVRNFIPAKNSSGVVGMYDTVTNTFFTNSGTGSFIAGPEVN